ncbi:pyridoxamine 5'-phosphate oxidase family protein [Kutzneria buriramensis]|uniref:Nitroimidazol reductase NimA-like FMN-containing flavoprotein (Pyridoxamine 5'-phosphate oxidase superfamily) n=1 Tax=Kutzneria buriramensis TaxID=1045776 RepID=A0A3E0GXW2_9PSEU|nr:pyridoxamine 5'-phosphate oxidase family protein [Kutzneria buriramensis]REH34788.1 nitroimidazol reductase NimA-like FMN-containing flavoprotein (pyridoxamine 5'-phosphate oxidase superfamily) [Kutzneria buriramensis]
MFDAAGLEVLDRAECLALVKTVSFGRIVFTDQALPAVLPVNFSVWDGSLLIRTGAGSKLAAATRNAVVAFEADDIDLDNGKGWSVVVIGRSAVVDHPAEVAEAAEVAPRSWVGGRDHLIRIAIGSITGRRVTAVPD